MVGVASSLVLFVVVFDLIWWCPGICSIGYGCLV